MNQKIKNSDRLLREYTILFRNCLNKPITPDEIVEIIRKDNQDSRITRESFYTQYLWRLKRLGLISRIEKSKKGRRMLERFYNIPVKDKRITYYFFTPNSAEIVFSFTKFMKKFGDYILDKDQVRKKFSELVRTIMDYEFLTHTTQEFVEYNQREKMEILKKLKKIKTKSNEQIKILKKETEGKRKIDFEDFMQDYDLKLSKDYFANPRNLEFTRILLKGVLKDRPFQQLINSATVVEREENKFSMPNFDEAIRTLKYIDKKLDEFTNLLDKNIQLNLADILDNECGFKPLF